MDYRDQESNSEGLFGARNENSVLFSLDNLNALDTESSGGGSGLSSSGEESGLIDVNTLTRMGASGPVADDGDAVPIAMESMVFNQVVTKREKRKTFIIIGIFAFLIVVAGVSIFLIVQSKEEALRQEQEQAALAAQKQEQEAQALRDQIAELERKTEEAKAEGNRRTADQEKLEAELKKLREQEAQMAAGDTNDAGGTKRDSGRRSGNSKADDGGSGTAEPVAEAPAKPKAPSKDALVASLQSANTKAQKCGKNGTLTVQFNLSGNKAKNVQAVGGSFKGTATEKCILTVVQNHTWPDGTASGIKYPFKF